MSIEDKIETEETREQRYITVLYDRLDELRQRVSKHAGISHAAGRRHPCRPGASGKRLRSCTASSSLSSTRPRTGCASAGWSSTTGRGRYIGRIGMHAENDDYDQLLMDWRADGGPAVLPGHGRLAGRGEGPPAHQDQRPDRDQPRRRGARPRRRRPEPGTRGSPASRPLLGRAEREPHRPDARHRRDHPGRAGPHHQVRAAGRARRRRAARAPARPPSRCTGPPTCSTPTGGSSKSAACWSSGRTPPSCATSAQVLPSLGETSVLLATVGDLMPGIAATGHRAGRGRRDQGPGRRWPKVVAAAVRDRQRVPDEASRSSFEDRRLPARPGDLRGPGSGPAGHGRRTTRPARCSSGR